MTLNNYYGKQIQLEIHPISGGRGILSYYDNIWEVHLSTILPDEVSAFILFFIIICAAKEVWFVNETVENESTDSNE